MQKQTDVRMSKTIKSMNISSSSTFSKQHELCVDYCKISQFCS